MSQGNTQARQPRAGEEQGSKSYGQKEAETCKTATSRKQSGKLPNTNQKQRAERGPEAKETNKKGTKK